MKSSLSSLLVVGVALTGMMALPVYADGKVENLTGTSASAKKPLMARQFTDSEVQQFLKRVRHAEAISDPLQRCLAYPDPPASHWSRAAAQAYCNYHMQPFMDDGHVKALIEGGRASELDVYLEGALERQLMQPQSA